MPDRPLSILLVEDHAATAGALAKMLGRHGFKVRAAGDPEEALQAAREQRYDLLITDIGLPGMSGWELFIELKKLQPGLASIALTGYGYPKDVARSREAGIQVHLVKPTTMAQVQSAILKLFPDQAVRFADANGQPKPL